MVESKESYQEWDAIFKEREEYLKENPEARNTQRPKTFIDDLGDERCTKCGSKEDISGCPECQNEAEYLNLKQIR